jgi:hypothetical protein
MPELRPAIRGSVSVEPAWLRWVVVSINVVTLLIVAGLCIIQLTVVIQIRHTQNGNSIRDERGRQVVEKFNGRLDRLEDEIHQLCEATVHPTKCMEGK